MMLSLRPTAPLKFLSDKHRRATPSSSFPSVSKPTTWLRISPLKYQFSSDNSPQVDRDRLFVEVKGKGEGNGGEEEKGINGIYVPRQKYISVTKAELLDAVLGFFESKEEADEFVRFSVCLDSTLHAEHKSTLEKMRMYYSETQFGEATGGSSLSQDKAESGRKQLATENEHTDANDFTNAGNKGDNEPKYFSNSLDLRKLLKSLTTVASANSVSESRVAMVTDFHHSFMKLLHEAQFEQLSAQDLMLTYALNDDYLLTLPIYVDWKKALESNAIIFRRGYASERQRGLLIVDKLDYLQSKLLQEIFFGLTWPLKTIGSWLNKVLKRSSKGQKIEKWIEKVKFWLKKQYSLESTMYFDQSSGYKAQDDDISDSNLPIWLAARRSIPRYEGFLSSVGPRGRLIRKLLIRIGLLPSTSEASINLDSDSKQSEAYLRPSFLPRLTLSNLWEPASRESCGNNVWKMLKTSVSVLFSQSTLQSCIRNLLSKN